MGRRSRTGESALFQVTAVIGETGLGIQRISTLPFFNYRDPAFGMVVKPFAALAEMELHPEWELYYNNRLMELAPVLHDSSSWGFER
jgi:hypothetical protein